MVIAVNTRFLMKEMEGVGYFINEVFGRITRQHPEHQFYFLFDREPDPGIQFPPNVKPLVLAPPARHPFLWKYWYDIKVAMAIKKIKADLFVSPDGFLSLSTRVPQCVVVHDLGFLHHPSAYRKSHLSFYRRYTPAFLKKAKVVATVSEFSKQDIVKHYQVPPDKIRVVYSAVKDSFLPVGEHEKELVRGQYTEGMMYFMYAGAIHPRKNIVNLLKAFSLFKKRQQSNWKLVLAGRLAWKNDEFLSLLKNYKYRDDVVLTGYLPEEELARLVASSYALVYPSLFEGFGVPVVEAMRCGVPVLTSRGTAMEETGGDAALYFDPGDPVSISEELMRIYKDEDLRSRLIEKGKVVSSRYSWDRTAELMWEAMLEAVPEGLLA
jgi:glycosyltransferase involved in cell wall biosynthesis